MVRLCSASHDILLCWPQSQKTGSIISVHPDQLMDPDAPQRELGIIPDDLMYILTESLAPTWNERAAKVLDWIMPMQPFLSCRSHCFLWFTEDLREMNWETRLLEHCWNSARDELN